MNLNPLRAKKLSVYQPFAQKFVLLLVFLSLLATGGRAQGLDPSFDAKIDGFGTDQQIQLSVIAPDGKVLIAGPFTRVKGVPRAGIARLNSDGSLDLTFDAGTGVAGGVISTLVRQPDGKVLIAGTFTSVGGTSRNRVARLTATGSLDSSFDPGTGANSQVNAMLLQGEKILIGGAFTAVGGVASNRIARLNANGTVDPGFAGGPSGGSILSMAQQADGKILIGGSFTLVGGMTRNRVARLLANGTHDTTFDTPGAISGANGNVLAIALQSDGKILIGGSFDKVAFQDRNGIARLHTNGNLDTDFNPGTGANGAVTGLAVQPADQKILLNGSFSTFNGVGRTFLARLETTGSLDGDFNPTFDNQVQTLALGSGGTVLLAGSFTAVNGQIRNLMARLNADGSLTADFGLGADVVSYPNAVVALPGGKTLIGGPFVTVQGVERRRIARLNADGSLDTDFNPGTGANGTVTALAVQPDGKILVGGQFTLFNGASYNRIVRLQADGSIDPSFNPGSGVTGPDATTTVAAFALQLDGKIIIGGTFTSVDGQSRNRLARLLPSGSLDNGFDAGTGPNGPVSVLALQTTLVGGQTVQKVIAGGTFTNVNGGGRNNIARFTTDGSLDGSFNIGTSMDSGINGPVHALAVLANNKILVGGAFTRALANERNRVARLNADGTLDLTFNVAGAGANETVHALRVQNNGKILIGGAFTSFNGINRNRVARLLADGTLDSSFDLLSTSTVPVVNLTLEADHLVLLGRLAEAVENPSGRTLHRVIAKEPQTITFAALQNKTYGDPAFDLTATTTSGLPISYTIVSGPATVTGASLTLTGAGTVRVKASQAGNEAYYAATDVEQSFAVAKAAQTITFVAPTAKSYGDAAFDLTATASSGLAVSLSVVSGPGTLSSNTLTLTGAGTVVLKATQAGNDNYLAAADVEQTLVVGKRTQSIAFAALETRTFGAAPFDLSATASSGLAVSFTVVAGPATLLGNTLTLTGAGEVTIAASQAGDADFAAAAEITRSFCVLSAKPVITAAGNTLTSSSSTGNQWYLNGNIIAGATGQTHLAEATGSYTVVVSSGTCAAVTSEAQVLTITALRKQQLPIALRVYPNPATTQVQVIGTGLGTGAASVTLRDLTGRQVLHLEQGLVSDGLEIGLEVGHLPRGTYLLQINSRAGAVTRKVVLQ